MPKKKAKPVNAASFSLDDLDDLDDLEGRLINFQFSEILGGMKPAKVVELDLNFAALGVIGNAAVALSEAWNAMRRGEMPAMNLDGVRDAQKAMNKFARKLTEISAKKQPKPAKKASKKK